MLGILSTRGTARPLARLNVIFGCVGLAGSCWLWVSPAAAFCIARTCQEDCSEDATGCIDEGEVLYYAAPCLTFGVQRGSAQVLGLNDQAFEDLVVQAFERWQAVDCGGGQPPSLSVQSVGAVDAAGSFTCKSTLDANLSVWSVPTEWNWPATSVGYTLLKNTLPEGEVVDADVELNAAWLLTQTRPEELTETLLTIATHEAGHALGMAHSMDSEAIMSAGRERGSDLASVPLNDDDIAAICALYPPAGPVTCGKAGYVEGGLNAEACAQMSEDPPETEPTGTEPAGGCSVERRAPPPNGVFWGFLGVVLSAGWRRRRGHPH
jgi:MYXO-CTERM domain-containing protein